MTADPDANDGSDDEDSPFPDCPRCGDPALVSVVTGPHTGSVGPCGCSVPPDVFPLERE
ncbi:hypothetical protein [Natrinema sp. H-ect4]|uniref:hypothetical protein n=1 Tax=Natrinema sp. H-ect4 TaxID=3242699 RepID=UPI0035A8B177